MNIIKELRKKKGIQQKELAIAIGVSQPTVSDWEANKTDPSGKYLGKLAEFFGVDELVILGRGEIIRKPSVRETLAGSIPETEQIIQQVIERISVQQPLTPESAELVRGVERLPKEKRELLLNVSKAMFPDVFSRKV